MKTIYENDKNHLIFFEPIVINNFKSGFDVNGPGSSIGIPTNKQVFAYHVYCSTLDENKDPKTFLCPV